MYAGNGIGDEGAKVLGEALKYNSRLTTLSLGSMKLFALKSQLLSQIFIFMCVQRIILVMKELKDWEKH